MFDLIEPAMRIMPKEHRTMRQNSLICIKAIPDQFYSTEQIRKADRKESEDEL